MAIISEKVFPIENKWGTPAGADGDKPWNLKTNISVDVTSTDNVNKITYVTVKYWVSGDPTGKTGYNSDGDASARLTVNGKDYWYSSFSWDFRSSAYHMLKTVTNIPIYHDASGNGAVTISATLHFNYPFGIQDPQVIDTYTVYTGAMATADPFTVSSVYDGISSTTAKITRSVSTNKHKFQVDFPNGEVYTYDMGTSDTITLNSTFWSYARSNYPTSAKETVGCWLWTYTSSGLEVGYTYSTLTINFNTSANNPTVGSIRRGTEFKEMNTNVTGSNVLQGMSIINITAPSITAVSGATITDVVMEIKKGGTYWNSVSGRTWSNIRFSESGGYTLTVTATDSRGNKGSSSYSFTVASYTPPDLSGLKRTRVNPVNSQPDDKGKAILLEFTATGTGTLYLAVKNLTTGGVIANRTDLANWRVSGNKYKMTIGLFETTATDTILMTVTDDYNGIDNQTFSVVFDNIAMSIGKNFGIGVGGLYNMNDTIKGKALQVFDTAHFLSDVTFDVPPAGMGGVKSTILTNGGSLRFTSGEIIQWRMADLYFDANKGSGSMMIADWDYPMTTCNLFIPFIFNNYTNATFSISHRYASTTTPGTIFISGSTSISGTMRCGVVAIGRI